MRPGRPARPGRAQRGRALTRSARLCPQRLCTRSAALLPDRGRDCSIRVSARGTCYIISEFPHSTGVRMRLSLRFILPLAITLAAIAYAVIPLVDRFTLQWFVRDLDIRTALIANTIQDPLQEFVREGSRGKVLRFFDRIMQDERLFAVGFCDLSRKMIYKRSEERRVGKECRSRW